MVAIFAGPGTGFERGSGSVLGGAGLLGNASIGRAGQQLLVNAETGNLMISQLDESLLGRGPDVGITRTYNSLGNMSDENGDNWRQSTDRRVFENFGGYGNVGSTVKRRSGDGSEIVYIWNSGLGAYVATDGPGAYDTLRYSGGVWTWTDGDSRVSENYSWLGSEWWLVSQTDKSGNMLNFSYVPGTTHIDRITSSNGEYVQYKWSSNNITDIVTGYAATGNDLTIAQQLYQLYDAAYNRAPDYSGFYAYLQMMREGYTTDQFVVDAYNGAEYQARGVASMSNDQYVEFLYTSVLRRASDPSGKSGYVAALNNGSLTRAQELKIFAFGAEHLNYIAANPGLGRSFPGTIEQTRTRYGYDNYNRLTSVTVDLRPGDNATADGKVFGLTYTYVNTTSKLIASISETGTSNLVSFTYVQPGTDNRIQRVDETGSDGGVRTTSFLYDPTGRKTTVTDALGKNTVLAYDTSGNLTSITSPADGTGAAAQIVQFDYTASGDVIDTTDGLGRVTRNKYDGNGNLTESVDPAGNTLRYEYDAKNQVVKKIRVVSGGGDVITRYTYDSSERLRFEISSEGRVTEYRYYTTGIGVGLLGTTLDYTANSYNVGALAYAANLDETTMNSWVGTLGSTPAVQRTDTAYDQRGNIATVTEWVDGTVSTQTLYVYDQAGLLLSRTPAGSTGSEVYTYDGLGRVKTATDLAGLATTTIYDDSNRKKTVTLSTNTLTTTSTYTAQGELAIYTESGADVTTETEKYFYDKLGRLRDTQDALNNKDFTFYDDAGRKTGYVDRRGFLTEYRYDAADRLIATVAWGNQLSGTASLYDANGNPTTATLASVRPAPATYYDRWQWNIYDGADRVVQKIETVRGDWETPSGKVTTYTYDGYGNLVKTVESANVLSPTVVAGYIATPPGALNYVQNAGFDAATLNVPQNWYQWGASGVTFQTSPTVITDSQGNHGVTTTFQTSVASSSAALYTDTQAIDIAAGNRLVVSENIATSGAINRVELKVEFYDANWQWLATTDVATLTGAQSVPVTVSGITNAAPANVRYARVLAWAYAATTNSNVTFSLSEPTLSMLPASANLLLNPSFDYGTQNWIQAIGSGVTLVSGPSIGTNGSGDRAISTTFQTNTTSSSIALYSDVKGAAVVAGGRYAISENIATTGAVNYALLTAQFFDANGQWLANSDIGAVSGAHPTPVVISGITSAAPAGASTVRLVVWAYASAVNSNVTLSISKPELVQVAPLQNLLVNPSFSAGTQNWAMGGGAELSYPTSPTVVTNPSGDPAFSGTFKTSALTTPGAVYSDVVAPNGGGKPYALSVNVTTSGAVAHTDLYADFYDVNWNWLGNGGQLATVTGAQSTPVKLSGVTSPAPAATYYVRLIAWTYASATNSNVTVTVAKPMLAVADPTIPLTSANYNRAPAFAATPVASAQDRITRNFYSTDGLLIGQLDGVGALTTYQYDSAGRVIRTTAYATVVADPSTRSSGTYAQVLASVGTSSADRTAYTAYDGEGRVKYKLDAYLRPTEYVYDAGGRVIKTIDYAGSINALSDYSVANVASQISSLGLASNPSVRITRAFYDDAGRLTYSIDAAGAVTAYGYDALGHQTSVKQFAIPAVGLVASPNSPRGAGTDWKIVGTGDFDGDGRSDLLWRSDSGGVAEWLTTASGPLVDNPNAASSASTDWKIVGTGDFNADGRSDVLWRNDNGAVAEWLTTSSGGFVGNPNMNGAAGTDWKIVGTGDFNADGRSDILWRNDNGAVAEWLTTSNGGYVGNANLTNSAGTDWKILGTGDFNADGRTDILWRNDNGTVTEWLTTSNGGVVGNGAADISLSVAWKFAGIGDFDGDGRSDVVWRNDNGAVMEWLTTASGGFVTNVAASFTVGTDWQIAGTGDFNGDGLREIVWRNVNGTTVEWLTTASTNDLSTALNSWPPSSNDRTTLSFYDALGRLRYVQDPEGYVTEQRYDQNDRLTKTIRWPGQQPFTSSSTVSSISLALGTTPSATAAVESYAYDAGGLLVDQWDAANVQTHYDRNAFGDAWQVTRAYGTADAEQSNYLRDAAGRVVNIWHASQQTQTGFGYDGVGNLISSYDENNHFTSRTYDALGRLLSEKDHLNNYTYYEYNAFGAVTKVTDPRNNSTYSYYDKLGRVIVQRDAEDYVTETSYSAFGDVASVTRRANRATNTAAVGTLPTVTANAGDATTSFQYDKLGRLTKTTDALGYYDLYTLNAFGERTSVRNKLGGVTRYAYNRDGQVTLETSPIGVQTQYIYSLRGNLTQKTEAYGLPEARSTSYGYDNADRLTAKQWTTSYLGTDFISLYSAVVVGETYSYDKRGNLIESDDANGARTLFYYDKLDRKIAELAQTAVDPTLGPIGALTIFGYDSVGNLTSKRAYANLLALPTTPGGTAPTQTGDYRETTYSYDAINRLTDAVASGVVGGVSGTRIGYWNGSSYVQAVSGITTHYDYDANGNVIKTTYGKTADSNTSTAVWSWYDKLGRKTAQVDQENYLTSWALDANGNVTSETRYANRVTQTFDWNTVASTLPSLLGSGAADANRTTTFTYDLDGRRSTETRLSVAAWYVDANGALQSNGGDSTVYYWYNGLGQVIQKNETSGDYTNYEYDLAGELKRELKAPINDGSITLRPTIRYNYDGLGNLTSTIQGAADTSGNDLTGTRTTSNHYTNGQIDTMTDAAGNTTYYSYDKAGHLVRQDYHRLKSDGSTVHEGMLFTRDLLGRATSQGMVTFNGLTIVWGDVQDTAYNAFGEVAQQGTRANTSATVAYQVQNSYDATGALWRTNAGDGVWKYSIHDALGNQTLTLTSTGADLSALTFANYTSSITSVGGTNTANAVTMITTYDRRGQATGTRAPDRQLTSTNAQTLTTAATYNAFGEALTQTDARGNTTSFAYNSMGRATVVQQASAQSVDAQGNAATITPTTKNFYDRSGRLIGVQDANSVQYNTGKYNTRQLLAGTGYGGSDALVAKEWHADGGTVTNVYNRFGDQTSTTDEVNRTTTRAYDGMGRLTSEVHIGGLLTDSYTYDILGQRITHTQSWTLTQNWSAGSQIEKTDYDAQGRVVRQANFGGDVTTTTYVWDSTLQNTGLGTSGGSTQTTRYYYGSDTSGTLIVNGIQSTDAFGHVIAKTDLGGHQTSLIYDRGGRMTQHSGGDGLNFTWFNSGLLASENVTNGTPGTSPYYTATTTFGYDANGNKISEYTTETIGSNQVVGYQYGGAYPVPVYSYVQGVKTVENATATYDALNRMTGWAEAGTASTSYQYDAVGNVRHTSASYKALNEYGTLADTATTYDHWFTYDVMNRVLVVAGTLNASTHVIERGSGSAYTYDLAGQRATSIATVTLNGSSQIMVPDGYGGSYQTTYNYTYTATGTETYGYDSAGNLQSDTLSYYRKIYDNMYDYHYETTATNKSLATFTYDALGRMTSQYDGAISRSLHYNTRGQVDTETDVSVQGYDVIQSVINNDYGTGSAYRLGALISSGTTVSKSVNSSWVQQYTSTLSNTYVWYDSALQSTTTYNQGTQPTSSTSFTYVAGGALASAQITDGRPRTITYTLDLNGQVVRRDESDNSSNGDPHEIWYRFNGKQIGYVGNNGTTDVDYSTSTTTRSVAPNGGAFRGGTNGSVPYADFDASGIHPINSYAQGSSGGGYTVRPGDTLASIAQAVWGDSNLWYRLAQANGLSGASGLTAGQTLSLPSGVQRSSYNASTFSPYDPSAAIGDTNPTTPYPQAPAKKNGCGVFGQILLAAISIAVAVALPHLAAAFQGFWGGVLASVAGSVVSQTVGVATGIQQKFSFAGVAMAAVGAMVGGVLKDFKAFGSSGLGGATKVANDIARGALGSTITQGVGIAIGAQSSFSWTGVAAAGLSAGLTGGIERSLHFNPNAEGFNFRNSLKGFGAAAAGDLAYAATRSLIDGSDFGDNVIAALPTTVGNFLGTLSGSWAAQTVERGEASSAVRAVKAAAGKLSEPEKGQTTSSDTAVGVGSGLAGFDFGLGSEAQYSGQLDFGMPTVDEILVNDPARKAILDDFLNMGGQVNSGGKIVIDPAFEKALLANPASAAELSSSRADVIASIQSEKLSVAYDFGYYNDEIKAAFLANDSMSLAKLASERSANSVVALGDLYAATEMSLRHYGVSTPDSKLVGLVMSRASGAKGGSYASSLKDVGHKAESDIAQFIKYRERFVDGMARTAIALTRFENFANSGGSAGMKDAASDMRAAFSSGHILLMPKTNFVTSNGVIPAMEQLGTGARSVINIYSSAINDKASSYGFNLFHEYFHTTRANADVYKLENAIMYPNGNKTLSDGAGYSPSIKRYIAQANIATGLGYRLSGGASTAGGYSNPTNPPAKAGIVTHSLIDGAPINSLVKTIWSPLHL